MNLRDKAKEIQAEGAARRGNFEPTGAPLRVYQWWADNRGYAPERENFCHFWRVVVLWAPLNWLAKKVSNKVGLTLLIAAVAIGFIIAFGVFKFSVAVAGAALGFFVGRLARRLTDRAGETILKSLLGAVLAFAGGLLVFALVMLFKESGWLGILGFFGIILGACALVALGGLAAIAIGAFIDARRAVRKRKHKEYLSSLSTNELNAYIAKQQEPGKVSKFFSGVGDFLILLVQIIRVKKWKICPTVTIDTNN